MADTAGGRWKWLDRLNSLSTLIAALSAAMAAITGYFGFQFGQETQAKSTEKQLSNLSQAVPASQQERTAPVFAAIKEAVSGSNAGQLNKAELSRTAQELADAVTGIPVGRYSVGTSRVFEVPGNRTALICGDRYNVAHGGLVDSVSTYRVYVEGEQWIARPGQMKKLSNGTTVTLMQVEGKKATFGVICQ